jgi:hypothetical protein
MPANGLGHFDVKTTLVYVSIGVCQRLHSGLQKTSPSPLPGESTKEPHTKSQDFAISKVSCRSSLGNPTSPAQVRVQASYFRDSSLARCHEFQPLVLAQGNERLGI